MDVRNTSRTPAAGASTPPAFFEGEASPRPPIGAGAMPDTIEVVPSFSSEKETKSRVVYNWLHTQYEKGKYYFAAFLEQVETKADGFYQKLVQKLERAKDSGNRKYAFLLRTLELSREIVSRIYTGLRTLMGALYIGVTSFFTALKEGSKKAKEE